MRKIGIASALGLVVLVVLGLYGASNYMLNYSLNYPKEERMTAEHWKNRMKNECPWMVGWMDSVYQHHCVKDTFVTMPSGYKAHAIYLYAPKTTEKTAVVVHGYQVRSEGMLHIAYLYNHDMGYNVLLPDLYGHGESEGDHIQMGWKDRWDVIRWSEIANEIFKVKSEERRVKREQWEKEYTPRTFVCKECGNVVSTKCGDTRREFCCDTCEAVYYRRKEHQTTRHKAFCRESKQRREKQIAAGFVESVSYERLYERDHGICQICGMPVPDDKFADDSWGGTIDHIVPLSRGGKHGQSNCQLTHRICNSLKSDTEDGFHIDWAVKASENPYWMKKYTRGISVIYSTLPHAGV